MIRRNLAWLLIALVALLTAAGAGAQAPQPQGATAQATANTTFTYQGKLTNSGAPVNAPTDFQFVLYNAPVGGAQLGTRVIKLDHVPVSNGLFIVNLDFGAVFDGAPAYLEVGVKPGGSSEAYSILSPRTALTGAPYALSLAPGTTVNTTDPAETASGLTGRVALTTAGRESAGLRGINDGTGNGGYGVAGEHKGYGSGIYGKAEKGSGVFGLSYSSVGVYGLSGGIDGRGVLGQTSGKDAYGVYGINTSAGTGVYGFSKTGNAIFGYTEGGYAGYFYGNVFVKGTLSKAGGSFKIDHPLDPANKYLSHSFVESPDMKNIYDGVVTLDSKGEAVVALPDWFEPLNQDFRYQLTAIGAPGPNLYIAKEIQGNSFSIAGGTAGMKISWQVTGIRQDAWANAHRIPVEEDKPATERGTYLHPAEQGQPESKGVDYQQIQQLKQHAAVTEQSEAQP